MSSEELHALWALVSTPFVGGVIMMVAAMILVVSRIDRRR